MNLIYKSSCRNCGHITNYSKGVTADQLINWNKECRRCREADAETHATRHLEKVQKKMQKKMQKNSQHSMKYGELGYLLEGTAVTALVTTLESTNNISALFS